jgi:hypothetical protein
MKPRFIAFVIALITFTSAHAQSPDGKYHPEVLEQVAHQVELSSARGHHPVVIFDLDETLINSRTRTLRILRRFATDPILRTEFPIETKTLLQITGGEYADWGTIEQTINRVGYLMKAYVLYPRDILIELRAYSERFLNKIKDPYLNEYLSNDYCAADTPIPGAVAYARLIRRLGGHIVYLTGRNRPGMGTCTETNLRSKGFPLDPADPLSTLIMKPVRDMDDTEFKKQSMAMIGVMGEVIGGFENEPANVNAFHTAFPNGTYGFVDNTHSNRPDVPNPDILWIRDFRH